MCAKKGEVATNSKGERYWSYDQVPQIVECSISYRRADWGPRLLLSFRTGQPGDDETVEWVFPLFVANIETHEDKLRLGGNTKAFWPSVGRELARVFSEGGVVTTLHNLESAEEDQRGDGGGVVAAI